MNAQFYVARPGDTQRHGPFTLEELNQGLESGRFAVSDLAWKSGTAEWLPITSFAMPPVPGLPEMPPLPVAPPGSAAAVQNIPPPPPWPATPQTTALPPPPAYPGAGQIARSPSSGLGSLSVVVALLGAGGLGWVLFDLWNHEPYYERPLFSEFHTGLIAAGLGLVVLLIGIVALGDRRARRGARSGLAGSILGGLLLVGGGAAALLHKEWSFFRIQREEARAKTRLYLLASPALEDAKKNRGGLLPNSVDELRNIPDSAGALLRFYGGDVRRVVLVPGLSTNSAGNPIFLRDSWKSEGGGTPICRVDGNTEMWGGPLPEVPGAPTAPVSPAAPAPGQVPADVPKGLEGFGPGKAGNAPAGRDLTTPEKALQAFLSASLAGDLATIRRVTTPEIFQSEFAGKTSEALRRSVSDTQLRVKSVGTPLIGSDGVARVQARLVIKEDDDDEEQEIVVVLEKRGADWLLSSI